MKSLLLLVLISPVVRGFGICATFDKIISLKPHKNFKTAMPFLWKYCNKDDSKSGYEWCYENKGCGQYTWAKHYETCAGRQQSPINIPQVVVYSAGGAVSSQGYPNTYYGQPHGCTKNSVEVEEGYSLAMKLQFETQCCAGYPTWRDDNITITDGNRSTIFDQREGFSLTSEGNILVNSFTNTASLKFCKYLSVLEEEGYYLWYDAALQPLTFNNYDKIVYGDLKNTGFFAKMYISGASISGGPLDQTYDVAQLHFHWGSSDVRGSEHLLNGKSFPLEMHIVHTNGDDIAVTGFFFDIDKSDNDQLAPLIDHLADIRNTGDKISMKNEGFGLSNLLAGLAPLGSAPTSPYTTYKGSLTTPPCTEGVRWINFLTPIKISATQMETFRTLLKEDGTPIRYNYRGVQLLNDRKVNKIDKTVPTPYDLDYTPSTDCKKKVVTGNYFDQRFGVSNVFENNATQAEGTYWLGPTNSPGSFIVDFGCEKKRSILEVVNVRDGGRATKEFRVSSSSSHLGPWTELVEGSLGDTRTETEAIEIENFSFPSTSDQYYKFDLLGWFGVGGGVQFLDAKDCIEGGHCASAEFFTNGFQLTVTGSAEFLLGAEVGATSFIIYSIRLGGTVAGDTFSVGLTTKCSVEPEPEQYLVRNKPKDALDQDFVEIGTTESFSFGYSEDLLNLLEYYVVVLDSNEEVVGCTTGRLSTGANPPPPTSVILVTGGDSEEDTPMPTVEIYDPSTGLSCDMAPSANITLNNHAQVGTTICGGNNGSEAVDVCYKMEDEEFLEIDSVVLYGDRDGPGLSWASSEGFVICSNTTCDLVKEDDTVEEKYIELYPIAIKSCIVSDTEDDSMILIGGEVNDEAISDVARYNKTGKIANLPFLIYHRHSHGCAGYRDTQGKLVVIAAGGVWPGGDPAHQPIDKTEFLEAGATAWKMAEPLPVVMQLLTNALINVDNVIYLIGGNGINDGQNATAAVLEWNNLEQKWREPGSVLNSPRINHAVGSIPYSFLQYCSE